MIGLRSPRLSARRFLLLIVAAGFVKIYPCNAQVGYRVGNGDTINILLYGRNDLSRRVMVDVDGNIPFPPFGQVNVLGLSLEEIQSRLDRLLVEKQFLNDPKVTVELAEAQPLYINGDVSKPGEYPFRPGISVRQLVALAGGYDFLHYRASNPALLLSDQQAERDTLLMELARQQIRVAFLRAELAGQADASIPTPEEIPLPRELLSEMFAIEAQLMHSLRTDRDQEKAFLQRAIVRTEEQVAALREQHRHEQENIRQLTEDLGRAQSLFERGLSPLSRIQEQQRSMAFSKSRLSENIANIALAARTREELTRRLQRVDEQRRIDLIGQIEQVDARIQVTQVRLRAVTEKLVYTGALRSHLLRRSKDGAEVVIHRSRVGPQNRFIAGEDTLVMPGDAVEVTLKLDSWSTYIPGPVATPPRASEDGSAASPTQALGVASTTGPGMPFVGR